jgi:S1-C subfamily serine protease
MRTVQWGVLSAAMIVCAGAAVAQEGSADVEARSRDLAQRLRITLEDQARVLSRMQRDLQQASRSDVRVRDSIVRETSQRISQLAAELTRVQAEADRVQFTTLASDTRAQIVSQLASARAMANVARLLSDQQRALTFSTLATRARPKGYLGVTLSGTQNTELRDGKVFTLFRGPVVIESVEAGSPAALGALESGDTVLAFGRFALPGAIPLAELFVPGERLNVRIRRGVRERVQLINVGKRPDQVFALGDGSGVASVRICSAGNCAFSTTGPAGWAQGGPAGTVLRTPGAASPASPPTPATGIAGGAGVYVSPLPAESDDFTDFSVAGAMMTSITAELEELTGVSEGILVLRVAPGTPAAGSGLRGGDVIVRINDGTCDGVSDLQRAVRLASTRGTRRVELLVSRQRKERSISLRW